MDLFSHHNSGADIVSFNIFCQHKLMIHVSCIVFCDSRTIVTDCLSMMPSHLDHHKCPLQDPACLDYSLWKEALKLISSPFYIFPLQSGSYVDIPHKSIIWVTNSLGTILHEIVNAREYVLYVQKVGQSSHYGSVFIKLHVTQGTSTLNFYASVIHINDTSVCMHSCTKSWSPAPTSTSIFFWDKIRLYDNPNLWHNLHCNSNGSWILEGICIGSLIIIHDGSCKQEVSPHICSAAVMILCTDSRSLCKCTIAEKSPTAGSY
jgi:hypothetical protein